MNHLLKCSVILIGLLDFVNSSRILAIYPINSYSHFVMGHRMFEELAARGHDVTVITPYEKRNPIKNLKHIVLTNFHQKVDAADTDKLQRADWNLFTSAKNLIQFSLSTTELVLKDPNVQQLLKSDEQFDLVMYDKFLNEAFSGFAHRFGAPCITTSGIRPSRWSSPQMGNPHNPSYIPDVFLPYSSNMNFYERTYNTLAYVACEVFDHLWRLPKQNEYIQTYFPGAPHVLDLFYNVSLMLVNSHVSVNPAVPLVPSMIEIGGYHIQSPKALPENLQDYLDSAKDGVIFFSMGSYLKSTDLPVEKLSEILNVFGKLKQKVLWKWEHEVLPDQPANVKSGKWLPQQDILAHPNVKLFITHGGLLSVIEAVYHGVPVLGMPIYGDQSINIKHAENEGFGYRLPYSELNQQRLTNAINELLTNPKYLENVRRRSEILRDQPTKPLDRAIYWIEYVIRHRGAPHLRTAALNLSWYQYLLLDVVAAILTVVLIVLWLLWKVLKMCRQKTDHVVDIDKKLK